MILTNNALISTSKSLPAWAAVGIVPGAAHIWSAENTQEAQKRAEPRLTRPAQVFDRLFYNYRLAFVLSGPEEQTVEVLIAHIKISHTILYFLIA